MRAAFFLWLTVVNLVALSAVWARLADVFGSGASKRLFGFLGAGATCGGVALPVLWRACFSHNDLHLDISHYRSRQSHEASILIS